MRILQITPQLPYPPDSGGRVAIFNSLQYLSRWHTVTLLSFTVEQSAPYARELERYCAQVVTVPYRPVGRRIGMMRTLLVAVPYTIAKFRSIEMVRQVERLAVSGQFDLVHIDHLHMAQYARHLPANVPVVLREHNVESVIMDRFAKRAFNPLIKGYATLQARRLRRYEATVCPGFDRCIAVTEVDGCRLREMAPDARIEVVPDGVDTEWFDPTTVPSPCAPEPHRLVTTGDYSWPPTADGLEYFVTRIYPHIRRAVPDVTLSIVGHRPPASVVRVAAGAGITVLGRVEDVRPAILRGAVFVVPTRIGSGIRLKILEAMALRRPVVSTSIGCEGIEATPGEHLLVADEPAAFAAQVVRLFRDPALGAGLATAAARLIEQRYAWTTVADRLDNIYQTVVAERCLSPLR